MLLIECVFLEKYILHKLKPLSKFFIKKLKLKMKFLHDKHPTTKKYIFIVNN